MLRKMLAVIALVLALPLFMGADSGCEPTSAQKDMRTMENDQERLVQQVPPPKLENSLERDQIARRVQEVNESDAARYLYPVVGVGINHGYKIKGKVTSLRAYLTPMEKVERVTLPGTSNYEHVVLQAPDVDGTYGENPDGVFAFTEDGELIEWTGEYLLREKPLPDIPLYGALPLPDIEQR